MPMFGADVAALRSLAASFRTQSDALMRVAMDTRRLLHGTAWSGDDAAQFRHRFDGELYRLLTTVAADVDTAAERLRSNADAQERTSSSAGPAVGISTPLVDAQTVARSAEAIKAALDTGGWGVTASDLDRIMETVEGLEPDEIRAVFDELSADELRVLKDQMQESRLKGGWTSGEQRDFLRLVVPHLSEESMRELLGHEWTATTGFERVGGGSDAETWSGNLFDRIKGADQPTATGTLPWISENEIEVRRLDNGKYLVTLPGVVDLSSGLDGLDPEATAALAAGSPLGAAGSVMADLWNEFESTNSHGSARDMAYARQSEMNSANGSVDGANGYATSVKFALEAAGVPAGADVMLAGHSFGAYTAAELATDPGFNIHAGDGAAPGGYNVTHVLGGGASAAFRMADLPPQTEGLLINNSHDAAYLVERAMPTNNGGSPNEVVFNGGDYPHERGVNAGAGHAETNYGAFMRDTAHPDVESFRESAFDDYGGPGQSIRVKVLDPYRLPTD